MSKKIGLITFVDANGRYVGTVVGDISLDFQGAYDRMVKDGKVHSVPEFVARIEAHKDFWKVKTSLRRID